jgi:hypothetical protein
MSAFEEKADVIKEITAKIAEVVVAPQETEQAQIEKELAKQKKREEIAAKVAAMKAAMAAQAEAAATAAPVAAPASESKEAPREASAESGLTVPTPTTATTKADKSAIKKKNLEKAKLYEAMFMDAPKHEDVEGRWKPSADSQYGADIQQSFRVSHTKGKTGASDFTKGKCAFVRPCTVGWRSQNQPVSKGGGNRTPL